jgi:RNA polymerase sigma-70 factor (ECF subfamily)
MIAAAPVTIRHKSASTRFHDSLRVPSYLAVMRRGATPAAAMATTTEARNVAEADETVLEHMPALRRYARSLTGDTAEADDLVQESLSRALARRDRRGEIRNLRAYLFTILHNAHVDRLNERRRWTYSLPEEVLDNRLAQPAPQHGHLALGDLAAALQRLPEEQRQAVLLVGYEGMAYKDAAQVLDVPIGTVMSRLSRGREALRRMMAGAPLADLRPVAGRRGAAADRDSSEAQLRAGAAELRKVR